MYQQICNRQTQQQCKQLVGPLDEYRNPPTLPNTTRQVRHAFASFTLGAANTPTKKIQTHNLAVAARLGGGAVDVDDWVVHVEPHVLLRRPVPRGGQNETRHRRLLEPVEGTPQQVSVRLGAEQHMGTQGTHGTHTGGGGRGQV